MVYHFQKPNSLSNNRLSRTFKLLVAISQQPVASSYSFSISYATILVYVLQYKRMKIQKSKVKIQTYLKSLTLGLSVILNLSPPLAGPRRLRWFQDLCNRC